jgi:predicted alpha/beta superfamily hydrolase
MSKLIFILLLFISYAVSAQNLPKVTSGKIVRIKNFESEFVSPRNIDIWLPEGYNSGDKYSVIYMHDGQMLFDSTQTWNKKEWKADEVFSKLIAVEKTKPFIVVGIWNTPDRITEYFPNKIYDALEPGLQKQISEKYGNGKKANGDNYLKFIVDELKPFIDKNYKTLPDMENTVIAGSSMGGLISVYAIAEYPDVFGKAASLSTAWLSFIEPNFAMPAATFQYLVKNMPLSVGHRIYMDYGTGESDKNYELTQSFVDLIALGKGYNESNYKSMVYENAVHDEVAWSKRLHIPFEFLLGK